MGVMTALDEVLTAPAIIDAMRAADDLAFEAGREPAARTIRILQRVARGDDELAAIAATHALAGMLDEEASRVLVDLLADDREFERQHAAWALGSGLPRHEAVGALLRMVVAGGFTGMLAQRTLEQWSGFAPAPLVAGAEGGLLGIDDPAPRARLVETLGLVRDQLATAPLVRLASDPHEPEPVRIAAVAALGQRPDPAAVASTLETIAAAGGFLGAVARLALVDLGATGLIRRRGGSGATVAQLFLHADIDPGMRTAGAGDNGGIATLLVRLGDALVRDPETGVDRVITLSRGSVTGALDDLVSVEASERGHGYGRIPLLHEPVPAADAWPLRVATRRGIRRILRAAGGVDVLHLRMADVGSLAAADVARELGTPVVFTLAPDPHAVIDSLDRSGRLGRAGFGRADLAEHFWFRTRLVHRLAANAAHTVHFPRPRLEEDLRRLVGVDPASDAALRTIVPEGVDADAIDRAVAEAEAFRQGTGASPALDELRGLVDALAPERRGLPLILSVGRLHRVKGMASLVEAWASSSIASGANLLLVGGDLASPSDDEREQLDRIDALVPAAERAHLGLLLPGHRPNDVVARWLAGARLGVPGAVAPGGVYACASLKEEFGIALLEAMAAGLFVVAPDGGGPATYVDDGATGILTATWDVARLASALDEAVAAVRAEPDGRRAERSRAVVRERFTVQRMAEALGGVYRTVVRDEAGLLESAERAR
ncbi:glycosyltransferase [Agromyces bracchium]|uniref:D-inositol 3-phosphate glycosyltransferase n=1 Tax=Agromyces bracchium TaxID=88376 RepID=A0A6I3M607_9MICO|nr:glycosyltransferase [Agromyces bracchium]MTH70060.1 glycosyltransferase [Agromyces bracchium]